ncbi:hypothetical protein X797_011805 [Metarhizium robertsii]|uniref:Carbohydrate-binding WSC domain protein n=2 Tax=Metarhizium robertsii TaxID=568076 RepID=E9FB12_METRA|nr:carbohydrate-binding WSC domain protein [Metarhizium robertsii ARSEF 23]EFY95134.1 carbohydrate-binding WSC domain protein [Metarhizium robertsii ARSEF 23]EXU95120.1 hypothetical protein X797_011805 [Metarhizium robertsii]
MLFSTAFIAIATAVAASPACVPPPGVLPNDIAEGFTIQVQNASFPEIHNLLLNQKEGGGGDQHLSLGPDGAPATGLTLVEGVITQLKDGKTIRAVINGQYTPFDNTTKMFMTERGDPRAVYDVVRRCNPETHKLQEELAFKSLADVTGGHICVRRASEKRWDVRYSPPGNTAVDNPDKLCIKVTLVVRRNEGQSVPNLPPDAESASC